MKASAQRSGSRSQTIRGPNRQSGGWARAPANNLHQLQQSADRSDKVAQLHTLNQQANTAVIQRIEGDDDPKPAPPKPKTLIVSSPVFNLYQTNPEAAHAMFQRLFPFAGLNTGAPAESLPVTRFANPIISLFRTNPEAASQFYRSIFPSHDVLRASLPSPATRLLLTGTSGPPIPRGPAGQSSSDSGSSFLNSATWFLGTAAQGIYDFFVEDIAGGLGRMGRRLGTSGKEAQQQVSDEHGRMIALGKRLVNDRDAVVQEVLEVVNTCYLERAETQRLEGLASDSGQEYLIKAGAGTLTGRALVKAPIKYGVVNPHVMPALNRIAASEVTGLSPLLRQQLRTTLNSRIGKFLASRAVTNLLAGPLTVAVTSVTIMGFLERATLASAKLKSMDPVLWQRLYDKNLDLTAVFVDDLLDKLAENQIPLRPLGGTASHPAITGPADESPSGSGSTQTEK